MSGLDIPVFEKDERGKPLPFKGMYWSLAHKPGFVSGVTGIREVGLDIERIKPVSLSLLAGIVDHEERIILEQYGQSDPSRLFFRAFTAKEAVLKKTGDGLRGLSRTKIRGGGDGSRLLVTCSDQVQWVEQLYFDNYIACVTVDEQDPPVEWRFRNNY